MLKAVFRTTIIAAALVLGAPAFAGNTLPTLSSSQSGVTVKVTPHLQQADQWRFDLAFDTHTQELKDDLLKSAVLVTSNGEQLSPADWTGDPPSGHHRKGVLSFRATSPVPSWMELRLSRTGESSPRTFKWSLK